MQQDMRYVYEIYRQKSFSKAAQALFITQPALSIAIGKLEAVYDTVKVPTVIVQNSPSHRGNFPIKSGAP